jgi:hypothetical protein
LKDLFRHEALKMLKAEGKTNAAAIEHMLSLRHSGFTIYCNPTIKFMKLTRYDIPSARGQ